MDVYTTACTTVGFMLDSLHLESESNRFNLGVIVSQFMSALNNNSINILTGLHTP